MKSNQFTTQKIALLGILSALGAVLMLFEIPYLVMAIDLSDIVVMVAFLLFGWKEAALVGLVKALAHMMFKGPVGPIAIGQITAFVASMSFVLGIVIANKFISIKHVLASKVVKGIIVVSTVTTILTVANYFFITPIWFGRTTFLDVQSWVTPAAFGLNISGGYLLTILVVYVPFNIIKATLIMFVFAAVERVIIELKKD